MYKYVGYKESSTSKDAAERIAPKVHRYRTIIYDDLLRNGNGTAKEIAARLGLSLDVVRPRLTELKAIGKLCWVGKRNKQNIWGVAKTKLFGE